MSPRRSARRDHASIIATVPKPAITAYRKLPVQTQCAVVDEIIQTRGEELYAAYPNVIGLGVGLRRRRNDDGLPQTRKRDPLHLRFMVERKWPEPRDADKPRSGRIPKFVLTYTGTSRDRTLLAVPTDVAVRYPQSRIRRQSMGIVAQGGGGAEAGSIACVIRQGARYYAISCRHVLSPGVKKGSSATDLAGGLLGSVSELRGSAGNRTTSAFDAQLIELPGRQAALDIAKADLSFADVATLEDQLAQGTLRIGAPSAFRDLSVTFHTIWSIFEKKAVGKDGYPHRRMVEVLLKNNETVKGDSGSPLYIAGSSRLLAGMHVAVTTVGKEPVSLCIPVWDLLDPELYGAPEGSRWKLL